MKRLNVTKGLLWAVTVLGGYLVTQGVFTGAELSELQNIIGMVMAGGGLSATAVIYILTNIPATLVSKGYDKAVTVYGEAKVEGFLNDITEIKEVAREFINKVDELQKELALERDIKKELGVYENLSDELTDRM